MYEIFEQLLQKFGVTTYKVSKDTGIPQSTFSTWKSKRSLLSIDKAKLLADYFGVSIEYLMTGIEDNIPPKPKLTPKDDRDINKKLSKLMDEIDNYEDGPLYFDGNEVDEVSRDLLKNALESTLQQLKIINKEKYNPNKNKK